MAASFLHIGIPITNKKTDMRYKPDMKLWLTNPEEYEFKIEYLKFEEGTIFPEVMHKNPHIAFAVDDIEPYLEQADRIIFGPAENGPGVRIAFIIIDDTIFELYEKKELQ